MRRVAVLGLGLIGGSLLQSLHEIGATVTGFDVDGATRAAASGAGYSVAASDADAVRDAEAVVLAMPLPQVAPALRSVAPLLSVGAVLTDVGTLKAPVRDLVAELAPGVRFVGGHPLAGIEDTGWAAAVPHLLRDCSWVLSLDDETDLDAWLSTAELVCALGARPVPAPAAEQDAAVARVIGLPHMLAETLALTGLAGGPLGLTLAAGSYRSGSRVARTRPELVASWCDGNPGLVGALDDAITRLVAARDALAAGGSVLPLAGAGNAARLDWEHRTATPVDVEATATALVAHGRAGGWLTEVRRTADGMRLTGMLPTA